jgi:preflagellin peptidase FlaK
MDIPIDEIRVVILILTFMYASYLDLKSRRVPDKVWIPGAFLGIGLVAIEVIVTESLIPIAEASVSVLLIGFIAFLLFKFRIFYGADYKAFVFIGLVAPVTPEILEFPIHNYDLGSVDPQIYFDGNIYLFLSDVNAHIATNLFAFTVLVNSSIFGISYFFLNAYHNISKGNFNIRRPLRSICARKLKVSDITEEHVHIVIESESDNWFVRGLQFIRNGIGGVSGDFYRDYLEWHRDQKFNSPNDEIKDLEEIDLQSFSEDSDEWIINNPQDDQKDAEIVLDTDEVWVTPGIPFIVPMTLGIIFGIFVGNIWYLILMAL